MTILDAYEYCDGNKTKAAELLGMSRSAYRRAYDKAKGEPNSRVLVIGDTHAPATHPDYVAFLRDIYNKYDCNRVVHIGDGVDHNAISFHEKDPSMPSPADEFKEAYKQMQEMYRAFPEVDYLTGNHSSLPERKAKSIGIPEAYMKPFSELWDVPRWKVHPRYTKLRIDGVQYRHGDQGKGGQQAALKNAQAEFESVVQGHLHSQFGIWYHANQNTLIWGMAVGCGVQHDHPAMNYGRIYAAKPILGCGVVLNGVEPRLEAMSL